MLEHIIQCYMVNPFDNGKVDSKQTHVLAKLLDGYFEALDLINNYNNKFNFILALIVLTIVNRHFSTNFRSPTISMH